MLPASKLFIVIYIAGKIGGTVGPLPYSYQECKDRTAGIISSIRRDVTTPRGYTANDVKLECEFHVNRPENDPDAGKSR